MLCVTCTVRDKYKSYNRHTNVRIVSNKFTSMVELVYPARNIMKNFKSQYNGN